MVDLLDLRRRMTEGSEIVLDREEGLQLITELETSRRLVGLPLGDGGYWSMRAQQEMVGQLLLNLSADVAGVREAELVAGVVTQELAALARAQVRSEKVE